MHTQLLVQETAFSAGNGYEFAIISHDDLTHRETCVKTLTAQALQEGEMITSCLSLKREDLQAFLDRLWQLGFRPTDAGSVSGELSATRKHLEDMRTLVFQAEPIQLVGVKKPS